MRKLAAFMLIFATWYFAGMNRRGPMMATAICAVIIVLASFVISRVMCRKTDVLIPLQGLFAYKKAQTPFDLDIINNTILPVNYFRLSFFMKYHRERKRIRKSFSGSAERKGMKNESIFYFTPRYSGMIDIELKRLRVYDHFGLFSSSKRLRGRTAKIYVIPFPRPIKLSDQFFVSAVGEPTAETVSDGRGDDFSEIRQIREYRDGDLIRHLHRNLSARTGKMWVKDYFRDNDRKIDLWLDTSSEGRLAMARTDAFCELMSAVIIGCTRLGLTLRVHWMDKTGDAPGEMEINSPEMVPDLFAAFFRASKECSASEFNSVFRDTDKGMVINTSLEWIMNGELIHRFDEKKIDSEIDGKVFSIGR